jgi:hypothetical protein
VHVIVYESTGVAAVVSSSVIDVVVVVADRAATPLTTAFKHTLQISTSAPNLNPQPSSHYTTIGPAMNAAAAAAAAASAPSHHTSPTTRTQRQEHRQT